LTGEDSTFDGVTPAHSIDVSEGHFGAFEIAGRYTELQIDHDAGANYFDPKKSARNASTFGGALNWYLSPNVKVIAS
ncbi:hypothetical protein ABTN40_20605, partial [Acinetobacter baumannii]